MSLTQFLSDHRRVVVITGAGISVDSGIPTYRDHEGTWQRNTPIQHQDFVKSEHSRKRYWARSLAGWPVINRAEPNQAHHTLAALEDTGLELSIVTQNVDRLHQKAGSKQVLDLHGRLDEVICLDCQSLISRNEMQNKLETLNPDLHVRAEEIAPDGDAEVEDALTHAINIPDCESCGGMLKPNVVFYGGAVDRRLVDRINQLVEEADAIIAIGTSLMVFSSFRFIKLASKLGKPIALLNQGKTRADELADIKISAPCAEVLKTLHSEIQKRAITGPG